MALTPATAAKLAQQGTLHYGNVFCHQCDSDVVNEWYVRKGKTNVEVRHLMESGLFTAAERQEIAEHLDQQSPSP